MKEFKDLNPTELVRVLYNLYLREALSFTFCQKLEVKEMHTSVKLDHR